MRLAELFVEISAKDNQFHAALGRIEGSCKSLGATLKNFAGLAAAAFAGDRLIGAMRGVVDEAIDMESRMAQLRKTTGLQGEALEELKGQIVRLGSTMAGVKLGELFDIATMGGRLGIAGDKIGGFVRDIGMIKVALDDIPAEQAAKDIARILNVFGLGTEKAINFASALNKLDDSSTATGKDILDISQRLSGSAAVLGLSPQKVLALSAALKDAGVENEVAGTAIGQVFAKMATDTKEFAKVAGVSTKEFAAALRADPLEAMKLLIGGLKQFETLSQYEALESLGLDGQRTAQTLLQLSGTMGKLNGYVATANSEWKSLASIQTEVAVQGGTTRAQLERMGNILQVTAARLGSFFLPVVKAVATAFGRLAEDVRAGMERCKATIEAAAGWMTAAGERLGLAFSEWPTMLALAKSEIQEKMEQLAAILDRAGSRVWGQLKWGATSAVTYLKNLFTSLGDFLADLFQQIGDNLEARITAVVGKTAAKYGRLLALLDPTGVGPALVNFQAGGDVGGPKPIKPKEGLFGADRLFKGVGPRPAFDAGGITRGLPNRDAEQAGLNANLDARAADRAAREKAAARDAGLGGAPAAGGGMKAVDGAFKGIAEKAKQSALAELSRQNSTNGLPEFRGDEATAARILRARDRKEKEGQAGVKEDIAWARNPARESERGRREVAGNVELPDDPAERRRIASLGVGMGEAAGKKLADAMPEGGMGGLRSVDVGKDIGKGVAAELGHARPMNGMPAPGALDPAQAGQGKDGQPGKPQPGTKVFEAETRKSFRGGLEEFARHLQDGIFGKGADDAGKKTAENTGKVVGLLEQANVIARQAVKGGPGYATGPA